MKLPKVKIPNSKKSKAPAKKAAPVFEDEMPEDGLDDVWEDEIRDTGYDEDYSEDSSSALPGIRLPKLDELLEEENFRKVWFGEIALAAVIAFASLLIGFAG